MKKNLLFVFFYLIFLPLFATHNRAGEITYRQLSGLNYEVTITTYTRESVQADRCELTLSWGDGTSSVLKRINGPTTCPRGAGGGVSIGNDVQMNIYKGTHTYPSSGAYILSFEDPNRNAGINNIAQSVSVPFYVQSELLISPSLGGNNSPVLLNPPIDDGCMNRRFEHNPGAFDPDGDSLSYSLVNNRTSGGVEIPTIYNPQYVQDSVRIDAITGDLYWDVPKMVGQFNFAIQITEWRKKKNGEYVNIGYVTRDLQVNIKNCNNQPPQIQPVGPFCVEAGQNLNFNVTATDPDEKIINGQPVHDEITLSAFGGPFQVTDPADPFGATGIQSVTATFNWNTTCNHVRKQPYFVTFEAQDDPTARDPNEEKLVDIFTTSITVVAPAPKNPGASGDENGINLSWDASICTQANGYSIYRREGTYGFVPAECETGVPAYTGYKLLDTLSGLNSTSYIDTSNLKRGVQYCYMVVADFPDGSESYASVEFCAAQPLSLPLMTHVDVITTDVSTGVIDVKWIAPPELDSSNFPPPYSYKLYRATGLNGTNYTELQTFNGLQDTSFTDNNLNTRELAYNYKVAFFSGPNTELVGESDPASSVFLDILPTDESNVLRMTHQTPWLNTRFVVYRETGPGSGVFDSIGQSFTPVYIDTGLVNGENYCYKAKTIGAYTASDSLPAPLINFSQEACGSPLDTNAPCPPLLYDSIVCKNNYLKLYWENPADSGCVNDISYYNLYYKERVEDPYPEIPLISNIQGTSIEIFDRPTIVGCYALTAVDDADNDPDGRANESLFSEQVCVEACPVIDFPNVFTPNNDGVNDRFLPISYRDIDEMTLKIFNRWGGLVYESSDVNLFFENGWDGTDINSGSSSADGVYYFICSYVTRSINTPTKGEVTGFVHLFRNQ